MITASAHGLRRALGSLSVSLTMVATVLATGLTAALAPATEALAADWPAGPVRIIIPFPPGGATDITGRMVAEAFSKTFGQQFIIDNRPGADTQIGTEAVVRARPDGQTLLYTAGPLVIGPAMYPKLPYDPLRDLEPVARVVENGMLLVAHPAAAGNVAQLLSSGRANPASLTFASTGRTGVSFMASELLASITGLAITTVPYKGTGQIQPDLQGGQVNYFFDNPSTSIGAVRAGRLRALAYTGQRRLPAMPEVPTFIESGVAAYETINWCGLLAPAGTPVAVLDRLNAEANRLMQQREVVERIERDGLVATRSTRAEFASFLRGELDKWSRLVQERNIRLD
jgi:tripartite-type tricarboxylate transporter receptor subunit TctC